MQWSLYNGSSNTMQDYGPAKLLLIRNRPDLNKQAIQFFIFTKHFLKAQNPSLVAFTGVNEHSTQLIAYRSPTCCLLTAT